MTLDEARVLFENDFEQLSDEDLENFVMLVDSLCKLVLHLYRETPTN